ncbi:MAG: hypothetical protein NC122_06955 [Faecalibacterium sp.]|nr:hypothetical protein [Ruminococcus sp.]MCM1391189.1 hypothetical protein [Ruminococcus sp.]MCM1485929.1 hypothetical protein [Faecalibacterium sp.]
MKIAKKTLSVVLSLIMIMSTCSVCFSSLSLTAFASRNYTADRVRDLVNAAVDGKAVSNWSGSWNGEDGSFTGDNGLALDAAEAVYDFAVSSAGGLRQAVIDNTANQFPYGSSDNKSVKAGTYIHGSPNASNELADTVIDEVGVTSAEAKAFIKAVLGNGGDTTIKGWDSAYTTTVTGARQSKSVGDDVTTSSNTGFKNQVNAVTKTVTITTDVNAYLARFNRKTINDASESVRLSAVYTYEHGAGRYARVTSKGSIFTQWKAMIYEWHQLNNVSRTLGDTDETTVPLLKKYLDLIPEEMISVPYDTMLTWTADALKAQYDKVGGYLFGDTDAGIAGLTNESFYVAKVIDVYFPNIKGYYDNLYKAYNVVLAKNAMDVLNTYIGSTYDDTNESEMNELHGAVSTAWDNYGLVDKDLAEEVIKSYPIIGTYGSVEAFEKAANDYIVELYKNLSTIKIRQLKSQLENFIVAYGAQVADPKADETVIDSELLAEVNAMYAGYNRSMTEYATSTDARVVEFYYEIFNDGNFLEETVKPFATALKLIVNEREAESVAAEYLKNLTYYATSASVVTLKNAQATARYDELEVMDTTIADAYNAWKTALDNNEDLTNYAFRALFENDYQGIITDALEVTKANVKGRNDAQLANIAAYAEGVSDWSSAITLYNFSAVQSAVNSFDTDLYNYCLAKGWVDENLQNVFKSFDVINEAVKDFKANGGYIDSMKTEHLYDENGVFNTRYAGSKWDEAVGELGYPNDVARGNGENDDFDVTKSNVETTIEKLDKFVSSNDFADLVGLSDLIYKSKVESAEKKGEDTSAIVKEEYANLSEVIESLLDSVLFTDDMFNTIMSAIYPMIVNLLEPMLKDLGGLSVDGITKSEKEGASGYLDLEVLAKDVDLAGLSLVGGLDVYLDGLYDTDTLPTLAESLGIYIYPSSLGNLIKKNYPQYSAIADELIAAGRNWAVLVGDDGDIPLEFNWNVKDYNSFITVLSIVLDSLGDLLNAVLFSEDVGLTTTGNAAYADGEIGISGVHPALHTKAGLGLTLGGLNLYENLWCKLLDALGVHDYNAKITASSSTSVKAHALFDPIIDLIHEIANAPVEKIFDIIPNLLYVLSMDKITDVVKTLKIDVTLDLNVNWETTEGNDFFANLAVQTVKLAKGSIDPVLKGLTTLTLDIADMLLKDDDGNSVSVSQFISNMLGVNLDYTNINLLLEAVMEMLGMELSLPALDVGKVISTSTYREYKNGFGNTVFTLDADRADILYYIIGWVLGAVGSEGIQDMILGLINGTPDESTGEVAEPMDESLVQFITDLLTNLGNNADDVIAALIELFNPKTYDTIDMEWVNPDKATTGDYDTSGVPYLEYGNDWTREKAQYVLDNVDNILNSVVKMINPESDETINEMLQRLLNSLFNNNNIDGVVEFFIQLGYMINNDAVYDLLAKQVNLELRSWAATFGEYFPDIVSQYVAEGEEGPDFSKVKKIEGVRVAKDADGNLIKAVKDGKEYVTWEYLDEATGEYVAFVDTDKDAFVTLFLKIMDPFADILAMVFSGAELNMFNDALTIKGYKSYANSIGILLEILGVYELSEEEMNGYNHILTQDEYDAMDPSDALNYIISQFVAYIDYVLSGNTIEKVIELIPRFTYFVESNGLSVVLHNLLMPILVILDDIRPILDVNLNNVATTLLSDILNQVSDALDSGEEIKIELALDKILGAITGQGISDFDPAHKTYSITLDHFTMTSLIGWVDTFFGTNLANSQLVTEGVKAVLAQPKKIENSVIGTAYGSNISTVDSLTIFVSSLVEALQAPSADKETSNGETICAFVQSVLPADVEIDILEIYNAVISIINGLEIEYKNPDWGYMFTGSYDAEEGIVGLPEHTIKYLEYDNDWDKETAAKLDESFDALVDVILNMVLGEDNSIAQLINGVLEDNVYTDANLKTIVELIVNAVGGFDESLRGLVDASLDTNIGAWFDMCDKTTDEEGNTVYVLKEGYFGVDTAANKKAAFVDGIKKVLAPVNEVLAWLFFGDDYTFLTGTKTDKDGNYIYNDVITIAGGKGYAYGLVPILEALGCNMPSAESFKGADGKYDVGAAVEAILNAVLAKVDDISGKPANEVLALIPNLIYFINANGLSTSLSNLLACLTGVLDQFAPILKLVLKTDDVTLGALVKQLAGIDIDITDLSMEAILNLVKENVEGLVISDQICELIATFYIGELKQYVSANGEFAYRMQYNDKESRADMITIILSLALDILKSNRELFSGLLGDDIVSVIFGILDGIVSDITYIEPNWAYMYDGEDALAKLAANGLPKRTGLAYTNYTKYTNNWNDKTAEYLADNLGQIINDVIGALKGDGSTVGTILEAALADNVYKDDVLNAIIPEIVKLLGNLDKAILDAVGAVLGADIDAWFKMCDIERDADGKIVNVTCTKKWNVNSRDTFVAALTEAVAPASRIIEWLFLGKTYTFFNDINGDDVITIAGGQGYANGIAPLLEALGCEAKQAGDYSNGAEAVSYVVAAILGKVSDLCTGDTVGKLLDILPNLVYFINAGGIGTVVTNVLAPVEALLGAVESLIGEIDIEGLIGFPIKNITFSTILDLLTDATGIKLRADSKEFIENFYIGKVEAYESVNGKTAYKMSYSNKETRRDMLTILLSLVIENVKYEDNEEPLTKLLGEEVYGSIYKVLTLTEAKAMQEFSWLYTEYADTNKTFTAIDTSVQFKGTYNDIWSREKAQYIADRLPDFIDNILCLLGFEINGVQIKNLTSLIDELLNGNLYTQANADAILNALRGLATQISQLEPYGKYVVALFDSAFGLDLTAWNNMTVTVKNGDKDSFADALAKIVTPLHPILKVLLAGEDISFFYNIEGKTQIVIPGSEGYAYGIIPLLEALDCKNVATPDEFKKIINKDPAKAVRAVIDPILAKLDDIAKDPANKIFDMIPELVYFIDSNGLDTCVNNIVNSVDTVLAALSPIIGKASIMELLGLDLKTYNFEWLVNFAMDKLQELTGYDFTPIAMDPIAELTTGKVVSYKSMNGETYYKMQYASNMDRADMVTVILRLVVKFAVMDENRQKVKDLFKDYITDEKSYTAACDLIDFAATKVAEDPSMSGILFVIYYIFYGLDKGFDGADKIYHNVNNVWKTILKSFDESGNPYLMAASKIIKDTLNKHLDGIFDEDGLASDGTLTFWQKIQAFFQKIINWFKNLFK